MSNDSESQDNSSSEFSLNLGFEDLQYSVRHGIFTRGRKCILNNISGTFNAGELTVIMGQSGAGKSSLMDILAGYTKPTSGNLYVNGQLRNEDSFRRRSCYILQEDQVQDMLTIYESLTIAAELKLGNHVTKEQKKKRIDEIITSLSLERAQNTRAGDLSGGQKKRLAIGLELISDPPIMFLDEPTSGLDISISKQILYLLHLLARQGRTVVITMHQPSATLLRMVDRLYTVIAGRCAYTGSVDSLIPYLEQMNLRCPPYHNPVDFLIEICAENANKLVEASQNGNNNEWNINNKTENNLKESIRSDEVFLTTLPSPKEDPTNKILLALKSTYSTSYWKQFTTLTRRSILSLWRNPVFTIIISGIHCSMALFVGLLFYNIGGDAKYIRDNFSMLNYSLMFLMFTAFSAVTITFPVQIPVIRREHFNRWYSTSAYFISTLISTLPTQTVCTLTYACIAYWLTGQPVEIKRFLTFSWTLLMVSYVAVCIGLLNGAMFNVKNGVVFGPFFIMPFTIFSGFFLRYSDAPFYFRWLFHISFLKHGLVGLIFAIYGMDREKLPCSDIYCHFTIPKQFITEMELATESYTFVVLPLLAIGVCVFLCSYVILRIRLKSKW
ncbi:ATP-binding cassette subfamily G member 4-like [Achroia grisella]|uniref:ATP-binding cassette subfamily G member 4-like n=1 Tax=Achroia grisella TaxID=688607 RepID=UPI0027D22EC1|nr:ATP-binding cassette subfamily G member 4-like [Achroia grisella]